METLESHVAHLERTVEQLGAVALEQGRELVRLRRWVERLVETLPSAETPTEKPPHYLP